MKKLLATTAISLAMATAPAMAGDQTDIDQTLNGAQNVLNSIDVVHNNRDVSQSGTNAGNMINVIDDRGTPNWQGDDIGRTLDDVNQAGDAAQDVTNRADGRYSDWRGLEQEGTNVQSVLNAGRIAGNIEQTQGSSGDQSVRNSVSGSNVNKAFDETAAQTGVNAANMAEVGRVDGTVTQTMANGADQDVANGMSAKGVWDATQEGTNIANLLDSGNVGGDVEQSVNGSGDQTVDNAVTYTQRVDDLSQSGTNVANMAQVNNVSAELDQDTAGGHDQSVVNKIRQDASAGTSTAEDVGNVAETAQEGTNLANVIDGAPVDSIDQDGAGDQDVRNVVEFGDSLGLQVGETDPKPFQPATLQAGTNVLNLATVGSFGQVEQQIDPSAAQNVTNRATYGATGTDSLPAYKIGAVQGGFEQTGTNLGNVLTTDSLASSTGVLEIDQSGSVGQSVTNVLAGNGAISDVTQAGTNVANSVSLD